MDSATQFTRIAQQLSRASAARDWAALHAADRELATLLRRLVRKQDWTLAERAALTALRRAHDEAREKCARESERVGALLTELTDRKDGWMAYALSGAWEEERS